MKRLIFIGLLFVSMCQVLMTPFSHILPKQIYGIISSFCLPIYLHDIFKLLYPLEVA